jgi:AraC-like DNA-binding protein
MVYSDSYYCGLAATVFLTTTLVVAVVRWFHMCRPYDRKANYYYPGRPAVTVTFLSALVLLPYALHPESADAWYLVRLYFLPVTQFHFCILLYSYFGNIMQWKKWKAHLRITGTLVHLILAAALLMAVWPGEQLETRISPLLARCMLYIPGILCTVACSVTMTAVRILATRINEDEYSNPNDFPVAIARRWTLLIFLNTIFCWISVLLNNRDMMAVIMLLFSATAVIWIISALHPHRNRPVEEEEETPAAEAARKRNVSKKKMQEILSSIHIVVVDQEAYLEPHLTIQDVADRSGYSRSYIAGIIKSEYGGFFDYINLLRLEHVARYQQQYPDATIQEAAEASGFSSRQAYYSVRSRLEKKQA